MTAGKCVQKPFRAYKGDDPYIFVSYAHKDASIVYPEITRLKNEGFNIWYDEGIEPGSVWRQELAEALAGCSVLLFFITPESVVSPHCVKELNFGLGRNRELLCVHLKPTELPAAVEFSISDKQAIIKSQYSESQYRDKLAGSLRKSLGMASRDGGAAPDQNDVDDDPHIQYCRTPDGISLAWSRIGYGPPIVRSLGWFTNIELEWQNDIGRSFWRAFARNNEIIRYDARGIGMSQRDVDAVSLETRLTDLKTVIDASGHEKVALMGLSEGGTTAIAYAATYPERVSHLILWGSFLSGRRRDESDEQWQALVKLIPSGWGSDSDAFRQIFTALFLPDGTAEHNRFFNEMQKASATAEIAVKTLTSVGQTDVRELAKQVKAPTLIMHRKGDLVVDKKEAHKLAQTIPGARLMLLEGANHWMWIQEDDTPQLIRTVADFVRQ